MPFTWTLNPYRGCEFACKYCYARYTHEFMELRDGLDFERKIYVKSPQLSPNAGMADKSFPFPSELTGLQPEISPQEAIADRLRRDLKKVKSGEDIAIGTATDPYQPAERRFRATQAILQELTRYQGLELGIVTKSNLILRDIRLLQRIAEHNRLRVNITVTTTDVSLARILEPRAPRPDLRLEAVEKLNAAGIVAGVICAPILPGITDAAKSLEDLAQQAARSGARYLHANPLFLKPCSASVFLPFLEKEFPHLVEQYRSRFSGQAFVSPAYRKRISALMNALRSKYGIGKDDWRETAPEPEEPVRQWELFGVI
jgi:DNA repair photolyase